MINGLPTPPDAADATQAVELLSGWIIDGGLRCFVFPIWKKDPGTWGVLLADAANHVADAMSIETGESREVIFDRIREVLISELNSPSDEHFGEFVKRKDEI